jgi:hypothetical protein
VEPGTRTGVPAAVEADRPSETSGDGPGQTLSLVAAADKTLAEPDEDTLVPLDFHTLLAEGIPEPDYLAFPYIPRKCRIWNFGPAEAAKSLYWQWWTAKLTREGYDVVYVSAENPVGVDLDRMSRLRPDFEHLRYFHMPVLDLAEKADFLKLAEACGGADLVVLDTLSALWSGDENSNAEIVGLDRDVLVPLVRLTGATLSIVHHMGHPQPFISRGGANAGRGASAMGQKADVVLVFQAVGIHEFSLDHGKNRSPGGHKEPKARFRIVDTEDGGLDIEVLGRHVDERVGECTESMVEVILGGDGNLSTEALRAALRDRGFGTSTIAEAITELLAEEPPRVRRVEGRILARDGKYRHGKAWVGMAMAGDQPAPGDGVEAP